MKNNISKPIMKVVAALTTLVVGTAAHADVDAAEIYCTIRDAGNHLSCQWVGEQRRSMTPEETAQFIDKSEVASYISVRSRKGMERVFAIDPEAAQFRKLNEVKKSGSMSEIAKAKLELFADIEKRVVKISDDLDAASVSMELVKYDDSIAVDKYKRELRRLDSQLVALKDGNVEANKSFEEGPSNVNQDATSATESYGAKYSVGLGAGIGNYTVTSQNYTAIPASDNIYGMARANLDYRWLTFVEFEGRYGKTSTAGFAGGGGLNPAPNDYGLKFAKCWNGVYCAEIDAASYSFVALGGAVGAKTYDVYTDTFFGASFVYRQKMDHGVILYRLGYLSGSNTNTMEGKSPTGDSVLVGTINAEKNFHQHHGAGLQVGFENFTANTATATSVLTSGNNLLTSLNMLATAYYKYSF